MSVRVCLGCRTPTDIVAPRQRAAGKAFSGQNRSIIRGSKSDTPSAPSRFKSKFEAIRISGLLAEVHIAQQTTNKYNREYNTIQSFSHQKSRDDTEKHTNGKGDHRKLGSKSKNEVINGCYNNYKRNEQRRTLESVHVHSLSEGMSTKINPRSDIHKCDSAVCLESTKEQVSVALLS